MRRRRIDRRAGLLMGAIVFAAFLALSATVALPATDQDLDVEAQERSALEERGMRVYRNEGCWYCHTQYLRANGIDVSMGDPQGPEAFAGDAPAMLGHERIGPDLRLRGRSMDEASLIDYLRAPGRDDRRTAMPSFAYLGEDDLRALAAYLLSLR